MTSGNIISLSTLLAPSDFTPSKPLVLQADAWSRVIASWEALEASKFGIEGSIPEGKLQYRPNGSINNLELIYEFRFIRGTPQLEYLARVNAVTGKTELVRLLSYNFDYLTCSWSLDMKGRLANRSTGFCMAMLSAALLSIDPGFCWSSHGG